MYVLFITLSSRPQAIFRVYWRHFLTKGQKLHTRIILRVILIIGEQFIRHVHEDTKKQ